jgi:hypothetical protein
MQIEYDIVSGGLADHADDLAFFHREGFSGIALNDRLADDGCATNLWVARANRVHEPPRILPSVRLVGSSAGR